MKDLTTKERREMTKKEIYDALQLQVTRIASNSDSRAEIFAEFKISFKSDYPNIDITEARAREIAATELHGYFHAKLFNEIRKAIYKCERQHDTYPLREILYRYEEL